MSPAGRGSAGRRAAAAGATVDEATLTVRALSGETWEAYAELAARHNGVWGGCWCTWFHPDSPERGVSTEGNRELKRQWVHEGRAHAAVVFDGEEAVAWCQYGSPEELPTIYHRKQYLAEADLVPDYRVTCFFVDRRYRRRGVAMVALRGALDLIAAAGGGIVEGYPHDTGGTRTSASFLYSSTRSMFERAGFELVRTKGAKNTVMRITVPPA